MAADARFTSGAKSLARKLAMQAIYRLQLNDAPWQDLIQEFSTEEGMDRADSEYFRELVQGIHTSRPALDEELAGWMDRSRQSSSSCIYASESALRRSGRLSVMRAFLR